MPCAEKWLPVVSLHHTEPSLGLAWVWPARPTAGTVNAVLAMLDTAGVLLAAPLGASSVEASWTASPAAGQSAQALRMALPGLHPASITHWWMVWAKCLIIFDVRFAIYKRGITKYSCG